MKIQNNIKEYRLRKGLTLKAAAKLLQLVCADRLSKWEHEHKCPSVPKLFRLCAAYDTKPEELDPTQSADPFSSQQDISQQVCLQAHQQADPPQV